MAKSASTPNRLPVDPIARRNPDGRITRTIAYNRHLIPLPRPTFPPHSWKATCDLGSTFGHPEIALGMDRIEALLSCSNHLTEREIIRLRMLDAVLPVVIEPVRETVAARWSPDFLLPCFGNFPTHGEVVREFKERGGRGEVYRAIGFFFTAMMTVELIEARLRSAFANGNVPFDFHGGE